MVWLPLRVGDQSMILLALAWLLYRGSCFDLRKEGYV